jgi:hypothetical protein
MTYPQDGVNEVVCDGPVMGTIVRRKGRGAEELKEAYRVDQSDGETAARISKSTASPPKGALMVPVPFGRRDPLYARFVSGSNHSTIQPCGEFKFTVMGPPSGT